MCLTSACFCTAPLDSQEDALAKIMQSKQEYKKAIGVAQQKLDRVLEEKVSWLGLVVFHIRTTFLDFKYLSDLKNESLDWRKS